MNQQAMALCNLSETLLETFQVMRLVASPAGPSVMFEAQPDVSTAVASLTRALEHARTHGQ